MYLINVIHHLRNVDTYYSYEYTIYLLDADETESSLELEPAQLRMGFKTISFALGITIVKHKSSKFELLYYMLGSKSTPVRYA